LFDVLCVTDFNNTGSRVKRRFRLTQTGDIERVRRTGKSYAHPLMVLQVIASDNSTTRFCIIAGRGVGGAVLRNRARRILRAALQPRMVAIHPGWDAVLVARHGITTATYSQVQNALDVLLQRAGMINESLHVF
jgi:ribonuclease P protein component